MILANYDSWSITEQYEIQLLKHWSISVNYKIILTLYFMKDRCEVNVMMLDNHMVGDGGELQEQLKCSNEVVNECGLNISTDKHEIMKKERNANMSED